MKAIVLSCDKYHPMADHMIQCYQDIWPSNNFTFRIPYQNETNYFNLKYGNKVEMIKSDRMIKPTVLKLIEDLVDDDWVYWCIDDKYLIEIDENSVNGVLDFVKHAKNDITGIMFCRCRRLLEPSNLHMDIVYNDNTGNHYVARKNYSQFWIHQFVRVSVLRRLFKSFPSDRDFIAKEMDFFIRPGFNINSKPFDFDADQIMLVTLDNYAKFGESTVSGKITKNCQESMLNKSINIPDSFEVTGECCLMGELRSSLAGC